MDEPFLPPEPETSEPIVKLAPLSPENFPTKELKPIHVLLILSVVVLITAGLLFGLNKLFSKTSTIALVVPTDSPSPTVSPTSTPIPTLTPTPSPTPTPTLTPTPTPTPSPTPLPTPTTTNVLITPAGQDGFEASDGTGSPTQDIRVGRTTSSTTRGFVGFDISSLPKTAHIVRALLRIYQQSIIGDPYGINGGSQVVVDHLDYGSTISASTYSGGTLFASNIGTLSSGSQIEWKQLDVTNHVKSDLTTHTSSQFRLRLTNEIQGGSATGDFMTFNSPNSGYNTNPPQLVVAYY